MARLTERRRPHPAIRRLKAVAAAAVAVAALGLAARAEPADAPKAVLQTGVGRGTIESVAWLTRGEHAMTLSDTGYIIFWDPVTGALIDRVGEDNCQIRLDAETGKVVPRPGPTNCILPEIKPPTPDVDQWVQPQALSVSPDGRFAVMTGQNFGDVEAQIFDTEARRVHAWIHRRPLLWIGGSASRLIVEPADGCAAGACPLSTFDPVTKAERPLGGGFGGGALMAASPDAERFAAVVGAGGAGRSLRVWSSAALLELARFDLGDSSVAEVGFDATGGRVFARTSAGEVRVFTIAGAAAPEVVSLSFLKNADPVMTDIDNHVILARPTGRDAFGAIRAIDYRSRAPIAAPAGRTLVLFRPSGGVLVDDQGRAKPVRQTTGGEIALNDWGPAQALSPDGTSLLSDAGIQPIGGSGPGLPLTGFEVVNTDQISISPDGLRFAITLGEPAAAWVFDLESGRLSQVYPVPSPDPSAQPAGLTGVLGWLSNHRLAVTDVRGETLSVGINSGRVRALVTPPVLVSPYDPPTGAAAGSACHPSAARPVGRETNVVLTACYQWTYLLSGELQFYSARDWSMLFTLVLHPDGTWFAKAPDGRYDTNRTADTSDVRWILPGKPWLSLPAQTFMRDFYQPGLMGAALGCAASPGCVTPFKPLPADLSTIDTVLPTATITGMAPGKAPNTLDVQVRALDGVRVDGPAGPTHSGIYDLRLFRDGKLVGEWPEPAPPAPGASSADLVSRWANQAMLVDAKAPAGGLVSHTFTVAMPTNSGKRRVDFSAYAFNDARVKSDTASYPFDFTPTSTAPLPRRAYVIAVGVNAYSGLPDHNLGFAVNDARAISQTLTTFLDAQGEPGPARQPYAVVPVTLTADGTRDQARKADVRAVLDLLAGKPDAADRSAIAVDRLDVGELAKATPDDLVVIAFSGHGWANTAPDAVGDFYLLPSDALQPDPHQPDSLKSLISSAELTDWLRDVDAGEMAIIIDACHSAASVAAAGFKPGPMGDPGLGQLAYDKGIRILASTQADDVAQESERLGGGHGLLTYALVDKGLLDPAGAARDAGGGVRIDDMLRYVVAKMPALAEALQAPPPWLVAGWKPMLAPRDPLPAEPPHLQQPALFDFTGKPSPAAVKPSDAALTRAHA